MVWFWRSKPAAGAILDFGLSLVPEWPGYAKLWHVQAWINSNTAQSSSRDSSIKELRRTLESEIVQLERGVVLCALQCKSCKLLCIKTCFHADDHDCGTNHRCVHFCQFVDKHTNGAEECDLTSVTFTLDKQSELIVD